MVRIDWGSDLDDLITRGVQSGCRDVKMVLGSLCDREMRMMVKL